jgi:hypothetical protein
MRCIKVDKQGNIKLSEYEIQRQCISWIRHKHPGYICFSVPNEACSKRASHYKATGMLVGVSDLVLLKGDKPIFIEMKTPVGKQRTEQRTFQANVEALGYKYYICRSLEQFISIVESDPLSDE